MNTERSSSFDLTWRSIVRVLLAALLVWLWFQLWQLAMVILVSIVVAVALDPLVGWLERHGWPRWLGSSAAVFAIAGAAFAMVFSGWSTITSQSQLILGHLESLDRQLRSSFPFLNDLLPETPRDATSWLAHYAARLAASASRAAVLVTIGFILTVYLLIEWKQTVEWLMAFFAVRHRTKLRRTASEARAAVFGYVVGNVLTSIFAACVVFAGLALMRVPAALTLALLAGVCDFVPVLGFVVSGVPAVLLAATVSPTVVILVIALYASYHVVENYLIAPLVYGGHLSMSNLAVLLAFAVGAELAGVIGALLALPIAATYPAVERIWLREYLGEDAVARHEQMAGVAEGEDSYR